MPFADTLQDFTTSCLTGAEGVYHDLIKNNIEGTLIKGFPLAHALLSQEQWQTVVEDFFLNGHSTSPFLWKLPKAFLSFVKKKKYQKRWNIPFLDELLHFEWIEIELFMQKDIPLKLKKDLLYLNPEGKLLHYNYPVFEKLSIENPPPAGSYTLFGYRHPDTCQVHFISLSPLFALALQQLSLTPMRGEDLITQVAAPFGAPFLSNALEASRPFFQDLLAQKALLLR